jgi:hypothetical protein
MSHAVVLVALSPQEVKQHSGIEEAISFEMAPFDENGTCFRDGSRWDWYQVGGRFSGKFYGMDVVTVGDLDLIRLQEYQRANLVENYHEAMAKEPTHREFIYGVKDGESLTQYLERKADGVVLASYAFLRERHWHEGERMGWFGGTAYTECEIKAREAGNTSVEEMIRRCKFRDESTGASVVVWNEPEEIWRKQFYKRFVEPLPPETTLVNVDYHV